MARVAVLGMGLLGSGFAERMVDQGHEVAVWNRTASKCAPLVERGARQGESPADAVRGAERVHLVLSEDAAVDAVIEGLRPALGDGVPLLDHSTNLPAGVAARFARLRGEGVRYLHLPVFMGPANARAGTGLMLLSGPDEEREALRPVLETLTGRVIDCGARPEQGAALKLVGNGMLFVLSAGMGDLLRVGREAGLRDEEVIGLFDAFAPSPAAIGKRLLAAGGEQVGFELTMARKDARLMITSAGGPERLLVLPAIAEAMDAAIDAGHGPADYPIFAAPKR